MKRITFVLGLNLAAGLMLGSMAYGPRGLVLACCAVACIHVSYNIGRQS